MAYSLITNNKIKIGATIIAFSQYTIINKIIQLGDLIYFNTSPSEIGLDWKNSETHQIWKDRCKNNPSELFCYNVEGLLIWKFPHNNVVGFGLIIPELKKKDEFITPSHYKRYIERFKGKELLEVYAGDFRYVLDANTGEIYDKMESR